MCVRSIRSRLQSFVIPVGWNRTGIWEGGKKMYETPMLVEVGAFTDLTRAPRKRGHGHDHRCKNRKRPKGGYGY